MSVRDRVSSHAAGEPSRESSRKPSGKPSGKWFLGAVLVSLCAHALTLHLPLPKPSADNPASEPDTAERAISQTRATEAISVAKLPVRPPSQPSIQQPPQPNPPTVTAPPASIQPVVQSPQPSPKPTYQPAPAVIAPIVQQPNPTPSPQPSPTPSPDPTPPAPEQGMVIALTEAFPHFAEAQSGCFSLSNCHRVSGQGSYRQAAKQLVEEMQANGYQVKQRDDIDDQGHRVYEVVIPSEPDATYYLNVFSDSADSMVYALTLQIVSLAELQQLAS